MIGELLSGITMNLLVMLVHVAATLMLMQVTDWLIPTPSHLPSRKRHILLMMIAVAVMLCAHLAEVGLWSGVYWATGIVPNAYDAYYSAFNTYTALGLGHAVEREEWRLLEPMTSVSGILMFGWTTAILIAALQRGSRHNF